MSLTLFVFVAFIASALSAVTINDCPSNLPRDRYLRAHGNSCYIFVLSHQRQFDSAERECESRGGHLVIIRDLATQQFLYNTLKQEFHYNGVVWIGLSDEKSEGRFVWVDGTPARFTYWASGQPGFFSSLEDCAAMDISEGGRWHDYKCSDLLFISYDQTFVCEYPIVKNTVHTMTMTTPPTSPTITTTTATPQPTITTPATTQPPTTSSMPQPTMTTPQATTTTPVPTTTMQQPTTTTPMITKVAPTTITPAPTTTTPLATTGCPAFNCSLDCGLSGYKVNENSCLLCECED